MTLLGKRKWSVCMVTLVLAFILSLVGKLTGEFATVAAVVAGGYQAANALKGRSGG